MTYVRLLLMILGRIQLDRDRLNPFQTSDFRSASPSPESALLTAYSSVDWSPCFAKMCILHADPLSSPAIYGYANKSYTRLQRKVPGSVNV